MNKTKWMVSYPVLSRHYSQILPGKRTFNDLPQSLAFVIANFQTWKSDYSISYVDSHGNVKQFLSHSNSKD